MDITLVTRIISAMDMGDAVQMNNNEVEQLTATLKGAAGGRAVGATTVIGHLGPCHLGQDRIKGVKNVEYWIRDAEAKIKVLKLNSEEEKRKFIKSCAMVIGPWNSR